MNVICNRTVGMFLFAICSSSVVAMANPLDDALRQAYARNPRLEAERANLRALDEEVAREYSGYRPSVVVSADAGVQSSREKPSSLNSSGVMNQRGYGVAVSQPLFNGFRTFYGVREAKANVEAGRASLRGVEAAVLLEVVTAYVNIVRDQELLNLRQASFDRLTKELSDNRSRRQQGSITRTDVSQTVAQRAAFESLLRTAEANLQASRAAYERVVGSPPGRLRELRLARLPLPASAQEAVDWAGREQPSVVAARFREEAARNAVDRIRGELLPSAQLQATYSRQLEPSVFADEAETMVVRGSVNVPLYTGGAVEARVRQAKQTHLSRAQMVSQATAEARAQAAQSWANWNALRRRLSSDELVVKASADALDGVRKEEGAGQRSIAELLSAHLALVNAQASLTSTRNELVVASYSLLSAVGRISAENLALSVAYYDPDDYAKVTHRRWFGLAITHSDGRVEHLEATSERASAKSKPH